ncbi:hypothetical protein JL100_028385 [Skermanella mucosa]|uniref:hypothetical protein n=1 Tax=Skermanella mucosa TaxID=1789672 RepID=UPI00192CC76C|nr:hypothetical protein [Skermanella mucosa]UEM20934.1 hypothetical protein JL100_028385 [Skermanella mucosa]
MNIGDFRWMSTNGVIVGKSPIGDRSVPGAISQGEVPDEALKHVPRYPPASAMLIGRPAIARERQGQGLGAVLLADAVRRAYGSAGTVGSSMVVADALDENAARSRASHGFSFRQR